MSLYIPFYEGILFFDECIGELSRCVANRRFARCSKILWIYRHGGLSGNEHKMLLRSNGIN